MKQDLQKLARDSAQEADEVYTHSDITRILAEWAEGDSQALGRLIDQVYSELRNLARQYLSHNAMRHSLPPTALVNEFYIRLTQRSVMTFDNRRQFFHFAGKVLRQILVDYARLKGAEKRGANQPMLDVNQGFPEVNLHTEPERVLMLHEALEAFQVQDARAAKIVELRYFLGLQIAEVAEALELSEATVYRELSTAKLWLVNFLETK